MSLPQRRVMLVSVWLLLLILVGYYGHAWGPLFLAAVWAILGVLGLRLLRDLRATPRVDGAWWQN